MSKSQESEEYSEEQLEPGELYEDESGSIKCINCNQFKNDIYSIEEHIKLECCPDVNSNNLYKLDSETLGKYYFPNDKNAGEIYIIRNNLDVTDIYKIGITRNLCGRLSDYRCGNAYEPILYYYFPCKDIDVADKMLKIRVSDYTIKREIYKGSICDFKDIILDITRIINNSPLLSIVYKPKLKKYEITSCNNCDKIFLTTMHLDKHLEECDKYCDYYIADLQKLCDQNEEYAMHLTDTNKSIRSYIRNISEDHKAITDSQELIEIKNKEYRKCIESLVETNDEFIIKFKKVKKIEKELNKIEDMYTLEDFNKLKNNILKLGGIGKISNLLTLIESQNNIINDSKVLLIDKLKKINKNQ